MKQFKRVFSLVVVMLMLVGLIPAVNATEDDATVDLTYGPAIGVGTNAVQDDQYLVYGSNRWFVMDNSLTSTDVKGISVISENIVEANIAFNAGGLDHSWANSDAKKWNEAYAAENFSSAELAAILATTKGETAGSYFGANWNNDALNGEKLFFLSAAEVESYFYDSIDGLIASCDDVNEGWWIRSAYADRGIYGGIVSDSGYVGYPHIAATWGARPAFNVADADVAISSAAVGGKVSGAVGANSLTAVGESTVDSWKLTVIDDSHKSFAATIGNGSATIEQSIGYDAWTLPISYSGAVAGENEYVSVLICNQTGTAVYYGHIAENSASGTVDLVMPQGLSGKYTIYVFAEQCNGDNATDYGSALTSAEIVIADGMAEVHKWGLVLEGDIRADFKMDLEDTFIDDEGASIRVTINGKSTTIPVSTLVADANGYYDISVNVAAAQMTDDIMIQAINADTEGSIYRYSIKLYGDYMIANSDNEKVVDLVKSMLNYGGKAQDYFAYNTGKKADNGISITFNDIPYTENLAAVKTGSSSNVTFYGASLLHQNKTGIRFYFTSNGDGINNVTFSTDTEPDLEVIKSGNMYYVEISDIAPNQLCDEITVYVDGLSVTYSPFYYIHRMYYRDTSAASLRDLVYAMYNYYYYASAYLA